MKPRILILNASLNGGTGNTAVLLDRAAKLLRRKATVERFGWSEHSRWEEVEPLLRKADALIFGTGTNWDSWSHHLQRFLEEATPSEGTPLWVGKPAGVIVTMHSVGGKGVVSRLQGVLNTFGCLIPPMSGLVYALVNEAAIKSGSAGTQDLWCVDDVGVVCHNVIAALKTKPRYKTWPVDRSNYSARWIDSNR
jgi:hypothetical protein